MTCPFCSDTEWLHCVVWGSATPKPWLSLIFTQAALPLPNSITKCWCWEEEVGVLQWVHGWRGCLELRMWLLWSPVRQGCSRLAGYYLPYLFLNPWTARNNRNSDFSFAFYVSAPRKQYFPPSSIASFSELFWSQVAGIQYIMIAILPEPSIKEWKKLWFHVCILCVSRSETK